MAAHFESRPAANELSDYYRPYVSKVPDGDVLQFLVRQASAASHFFRGIGEAASLHRCAEGKWSIREIIGHLSDGERVFGYRALRFARGDDTELPGFDQDPYVVAAKSDERPLFELVDEWYQQRLANVALFRSFSANELSRWGTASGSKVTVRALLFIIGGHVEHHIRVIKDQYLPGLSASV